MKNNLSRNLVFFITVVFFFNDVFLLFALDPTKTFTQYVQDNWQTDQGLPQNAIYCITQTKDGFLWIGTEEGVARFDGVRFTVFNKANTPEIKNNIINALFADREGNLWIGTYGGGVTEYKNGQFIHYGSEEGIVDDHVICIYQDSKNVLWIGTRNGLSRFHQGRFESYRTDRGLPHNWVVALADDFEGGLWIATAKGLCHWRQQKITPVPIVPPEVISSLYSAGPEDLWFGTYNSVNHLFHNHLDSYSLDTNIPKVLVRAIYPDRDKNWWIATRGTGLTRFRNGKFESSTTKENFMTDMVNALYEDREGSLWIGTFNGLSRLRNGKFTTSATEEGLSFDRIWCVFEDSMNQVWIGTDGGGLNLLRNGKFSHFAIRDGLSSDLVSSLAEDQSGNLWIGTLGGGLNRLKNGRFTHYAIEDGLAGAWIWAIHPARDGSIWISTYNQGLSVLRNGKFTTYNTSNGFPSNSVRSIYEAPDGGLYFATEGAGLVRWKEGKITTYLKKEGSAGNDLNFIYVDSQRTFWITTLNQGLIRFKDGRATNITQKDGLLDDAIHGILEDHSGNLWMSTNRGIFKVKKQILEDFAFGKIHSFPITKFGKSDGMRSDECNGGYQPSVWKTRDGKLWFPTTKGVVVIDPERITMNHLVPPVQIQEILVNNEMTNTKVFQPGKNKFEFHYTALSFLEPQKVHFKYKIEGFDKDWVDAGTRRVAYYTNLSPGTYRFKVEACNNDGVWNAAGASTQFYLKPYFYQTGWFYLLCVAASILAATGLHRLRLRKVRREFKAVLLERTRIAREIHDGLVQSLAGVVLQLETAQQLSSQESAKRHFNRALDLARQGVQDARHAIDNLRPVELRPADFPEHMRSLMQQQLQNSNVSLDFAVIGEPLSLSEATQSQLLRICQESIQNVLKHSEAENVNVKMEYGKSLVRLSIRDNGKGFDPNSVSPQGHFGLIGMRERAAGLGANLQIQSHAGEGTLIRVSVPC